MFGSIEFSPINKGGSCAGKTHPVQLPPCLNELWKSCLPTADTPGSALPIKRALWAALGIGPHSSTVPHTQRTPQGSPSDAGGTITIHSVSLCTYGTHRGCPCCRAVIRPRGSLGKPPFTSCGLSSWRRTLFRLFCKAVTHNTDYLVFKDQKSSNRRLSISTKKHLLC